MLSKSLNFLQSATDVCFSLIPRRFPEGRKANDVCLVAHRGAHDVSLGILENTHQAFERALAMSCWGIELDINETKDKALLVHHDPDLKRICGIDKTIRENTLEVLRAEVPELLVLNDIVRLYGKKLHLFIELKEPFTSEKALQEALSPLIPCIDYHLISLSPDTFEKLTTFPRACFLLVSGHNNVKKYAKLCLQHNYGGLLGHYVLMSDKVIQQMKIHNKAFGVGFLESKNSLYREMNRNIPWLFTDNVTLISSHLRAFGKETTLS
ncbi:MAG: glycerophosphodiester phosphodiesterase [Legionella sp.]|nr:glycerophosphodiester phosphodiesterase [Legionella sp.]